MSNRKSERLLNLLILLLVQRHYITKERIRSILYSAQSDEAFEKMFERDKEELRSLGVPIEVGALDAFFDDELGYRVRPDAFALPVIQFTADEAAVVSVATKVWDHARLAGVTTDAVRKLASEGVNVDSGALDFVAPRIGVEEPSFEDFWDATLQRSPVQFLYGRPGEAPNLRRVEPWRVIRSSGRWYVAGFDLDRQGSRVFRLSRVSGSVEKIGVPGSYVVPEIDNVKEMVRGFTPSLAESVIVHVRPARAAPLRRRASELVDLGEWDRLVLEQLSVAEALSYGTDLMVISPAALRREIVEQVTGALT